MKKLTFFFSLFIVFNLSFGQTNSLKPSVAYSESENTDIKEFEIFKNFIRNGSNIYLNPNWQGGNIYLEDKKILVGYVYKYNILTDQVEIKATVNPLNVDYITIAGKTFLHSKFKNEKGGLNGGYFEVLIKDECKLLLRRSVEKSKQNNIDVVLGETERGSNNEVKEDYYIKKGDEPAVLIKNKDCLLKNLSDKETFVEHLNGKFIPFMTKKKLISLIELYNQL